MKKVYHFLFLTIAFFAFSNTDIQASHIIGGEMYYTCLGNGEYEFTLIMYRDCWTSNTPFDSEPGAQTNGRLTVYIGDTGVEFDRIRLGSPVVDMVETDSGNPCLLAPPNVCALKGTYTFNVDLPPSSESYYVVYQRCCRNPTIDNIRDPQAAGSTFFIEVTPRAQQECNNSPRFVNFPPPIICLNDPIQFDHSAIDVDGDSLVYEFCTPYTGGSRTDPAPTPDLPPPYDLVIYEPPFTSGTPMGGNPLVTIDPVTGLITGTADIGGQYVVGICISEYRDGELLSVIRREFQFNVTACTPFVTAQIDANNSIGDDLFIVSNCGDTVIEFEETSFPQTSVNSFLWEFPIDEDSTFTSTDKNLMVDFMQAGIYRGKLTINPFDTTCTDTATIEVFISEGITADFEVGGDTCELAPIDLVDRSIISLDAITAYDWDMGDGNVRRGNIISHQYDSPGNYPISLTIRDTAGCESIAEKMYSYFPVPELGFNTPRKFGCTPFDAIFTNISEPLDSSYSFMWDFGDGQFSEEFDPTHIYNEEGIYDVGLTVTSPTGCRDTRTLFNYLEIRPTPEVEYSFSPNPFTKLDENLSFEVDTDPLNRVQWNFGIYGFANENDPSVVIFDNTDTVNVRLLVTSPDGCPVDELIAIPRIPVLRFYMPNVFSPNNDGYNDGLTPLFNCPVSDYHLQIFNRWGNVVFESFDQEEEWKFEFNDTIDPGVFVWILNFTFDGKEEMHVGDVTLVR